MNTIADFHELLLQSSSRNNRETEQSDCDKVMTDPISQHHDLLSLRNLNKTPMEDEFDEPSLTASETSFSSLDDLWSTIRGNIDDALEENSLPRRRVTFYPHVEVREYCLTLSDHPYCDDPYPISLDWAFAPPYIRHIESSKARGIAYTPGRRLFVDEKRRRLAEVLGCTDDEVDAMAQSSMISLGQSILTFVAKFMPIGPTSDIPTTSAFDEDDDEYLLMYSGTREPKVARTTNWKNLSGHPIEVLVNTDTSIDP